MTDIINKNGITEQDKMHTDQKLGKDGVNKLISDLTNILSDNDLIYHNDVRIKYHPNSELYDRRRALIRLATAMYPELSYGALEHHDKEGTPTPDGDFIVGFYTPHGPIQFHIKNEYLKEFKHVKFTQKAPLISSKGKLSYNKRLNDLKYLRELLGNGYSIESIIGLINANTTLDASQKPGNKDYIDIDELSMNYIAETKQELDIDVTNEFTTIINAMIKKGLLNAKELEFRWHKEQDLYDDIAELFNLCTTYDKNLAFISSKHYDDTDEMFNDDFITGLYTPSGPISFHFKNKEMDKFIHLKPYDERGPLYDGYDHDGLMVRMDSLILSVLRNDKEDVEKEINNNIYLHESHKPNKCVDSRKYGKNNTIKKTR